MEKFVELLKNLKGLALNEFVNGGCGSAEEWKAVQNAPSGRIVIRITEGGNEYLKVGESKSGDTPFLCVGFPVLVEFPSGYYKSTAVECIDWNNGTFKTKCSTYAFHFCN